MKPTARLRIVFFWHFWLIAFLGLMVYLALFSEASHTTTGYLSRITTTAITPLPVLYQIAIVCLVSILPYLFLQGFKLKNAFLFLGFLLIFSLALSYFLALVYQIIFPLFYVLVAITLGTLLAVTLKMIFATTEQEFLRTAFSQFVSPDMLHELLKDPHSLRLQGRELPITVMFLDIRGFTSFSEQNTPVVVVKRLNELLNIVSAVIAKNHGTIDKYMGDSVMAFWGAPASDHKQVTHACLSALEIKRKLESETEFKVGIGINHGPAIVGNIGSSRRFDFTAIGDTVNVAARLESSTKDLGHTIIISESVVRRLAAEKLSLPILDLGDVAIRGKNDTLHLFALA